MSWSVSPVATFAATFHASADDDRWHRPPDLGRRCVDASSTVGAAAQYT